jgi:hypothetical protein
MTIRKKKSGFLIGHQNHSTSLVVILFIFFLIEHRNVKIGEEKFILPLAAFFFAKISYLPWNLTN